MTALEFRRVDHVGLMVDDIDTAVQWYVDALGFTIADRWDNSDLDMAWAHLESQDFRLEIVRRPRLTAPGDTVTGYHHLALAVTDCQAATDALVLAGAQVVFAPSYFDRHHMDWSFVRDPFGNILELVSYRAADARPQHP